MNIFKNCIYYLWRVSTKLSEYSEANPVCLQAVRYFWTVIICSVQKMTRANILVSGRVQGVFFRDHTRRWATTLGLTGWVKNLLDGRVEILAEGDRENIQELYRLVQKGPPSSNVDGAVLEWQEYRGEFKDFRVAW